MLYRSIHTILTFFVGLSVGGGVESSSKLAGGSLSLRMSVVGEGGSTLSWRLISKLIELSTNASRSTYRMIQGKLEALTPSAGTITDSMEHLQYCKAQISMSVE